MTSMAGLKMRKFFPNILSAGAKAALFLVFLLFALYSRELLASARVGVDLCLFVIIPSLFPFFVLSQLFVKWRLCDNLDGYFAPLAYLLFRKRGICLVPFLLGITSGYPVGVRSILSLRKEGLCTEGEANFMLTFCSCSGPAFLVGAIGVALFESPSLGWALYACHAAAALMVGVLFSFLPPFSGEKKPSLSRSRRSQNPEPLLPSFLSAVGDSFNLVLGVSAFIIFFCVVIGLLSATGITPAISALLGRLFPSLPPGGAESLVSGLLEMTRGIQLASCLPSAGTGALLASFLCAFGGLSIHFQVLFLLKDSSLKKWPYFLGKGLHAFFSAALWVLFSPFLQKNPLQPVFRNIGGFSLSAMYRHFVFFMLAFIIFLFLWQLAAFMGRKKRG